MTTVESVTRTVGIPAATRIAPGALSSIWELAQEAGVGWSRCAIVTGAGRTMQFAVQVAHLVPGSQIFQVGPATIAEAKRLHASLAAFCADSIIAVGGGRVLDVAKWSAARGRTHLLAVPTSLANDGIASPVASLLDDNGSRLSLGTVIPSVVLVDTDIVRTAPPATLRAGVGDLLSNLTAVLDWRLASDRGLESYEEMAALIAESAALPLLTVGPDASDFASRLAKGLLLSGVAMGVTGTTRPCSGSEHLISHALDHMLGDRGRLHGEQVAIGTLIAAAAHGRHLPELKGAFQRHGLPASPWHLGLSDEDLRNAISMAPGMRPGRYTIFDEVAAQDIDDLLKSAFEE